jgi:Flp pilus assembly protein TadD
MMSQQPSLDEKIGEAWKTHYAGQDAAAIDQFKRLVEEAPDNIDAHWGLGLSYRNVGNKTSAVEVFQKVKALVAARLQTESGEMERYVMLNRMVEQQLAQIGEFLDATE